MSDPMDHSSSSVADGFVIPGERLAPAGSWKAGRGTYLFQGHIFASVVGLKQEVPPADASSPLQTIEVVQLRDGGQTIQPQIGDVVVAKVTKVTTRQAQCTIVVVNGRTLQEKFPAVIRQEDVRASEVDKVEIYDSFMPGDVVSARVLSLGDANAYFLTTAAGNEFGVISATCVTSGEKMVPIGWREMQCPRTGAKEARKVAKVEEIA